MQDPDKQGKVKVALKRMKDPDGNPPESWWARVALVNVSGDESILDKPRQRIVELYV